MTMKKYYTLEDLFDISCAYREYVMASTVLSMKFVFLMQIIEKMKRYEPRIRQLASEIRVKSYDYKRATSRAAATDTKLSLDTLLYCSASYSGIDLQMLAASIEKRILNRFPVSYINIIPLATVSIIGSGYFLWAVSFLDHICSNIRRTKKIAVWLILIKTLPPACYSGISYLMISSMAAFDS